MILYTLKVSDTLDGLHYCTFRGANNIDNCHFTIISYHMKERKEINIQIGRRIQKARETSGYTQEKLADKVGVSIQYISDLERGIVGTSVPTLIKICNTLCVSSDYILMGKDEIQDISSVEGRLNNLSSEEIQIIEKGINLMIEAFQIRKKK